MHAKTRWPQKPRSAPPLDHQGALEDEKRPMLGPGEKAGSRRTTIGKRTRRKRSARS
jgi:hypothetical protein